MPSISRIMRVARACAATALCATAVPAAAVPTGFGASHDLSPWGMFGAADWVVKAVMIGLILASVVTWTVLIAKWWELSGARRTQDEALARLENARGLGDAMQSMGRSNKVAVALLSATREEIAQSEDALDDREGLKERIASRLGRIEARAGREMAKGTSMLATIGATAPFVGLFGTVWGIMNSFIGIAETQTTNLAVVAPGIAEALLATALGLVAAIPAVIIYNHFARQITAYRAQVADSASAVLRLASRDLSRDTLSPPALRTAAE